MQAVHMRDVPNQDTTDANVDYLAVLEIPDETCAEEEDTACAEHGEELGEKERRKKKRQEKEK